MLSNSLPDCSARRASGGPGRASMFRIPAFSRGPYVRQLRCGSMGGPCNMSPVTLGGGWWQQCGRAPARINPHVDHMRPKPMHPQTLGAVLPNPAPAPGVRPHRNVFRACSQGSLSTIAPSEQAQPLVGSLPCLPHRKGGGGRGGGGVTGPHLHAAQLPPAPRPPPCVAAGVRRDPPAAAGPAARLGAARVGRAAGAAPPDLLQPLPQHEAHQGGGRLLAALSEQGGGGEEGGGCPGKH